MANSKTRYVLPALLFLFVGWMALDLILSVTQAIPATGMFETLQFTAPTLGTDILLVLGVGIPIMVVEYVLLAVPVAGVFLFVTRTYKAAAYDMSIMNLGRDFGGVRMIRRAAAPALFAVASSSMLKGWLIGYLFGPSPEIPADLQFIFPIVVTLMSSLVLVPVGLLMFMPTWVLNDAGIVTHLKRGSLKIRQTPDTQGVGRWVGNALGGFALFAYPISQFTDRFYEPYILGNTPWTVNNLTQTMLWTIGIPLFVMAFIMPVVVANEIMLRRSTDRIKNMARKLGAKDVKKEKIEVDRRTKTGIEEVEPPPEQLFEGDVLTTAKRVKKKKKSSKKSKKKSTK